MSTSTVAMIQSSYIPWKGYFDQINMADIFVFYDDVQYTKEDWRTRNRIKTSQGLQWLTIPCGENLKRLICDVRMESVHWQRKHWKSIHQNYRKAQYFDVYAGYFEPLYLEREWIYLSDLNQTFTKMIAREILGIDTVFRDSREFGLSPGKKREVPRRTGQAQGSGPRRGNGLDGLLRLSRIPAAIPALRASRQHRRSHHERGAQRRRSHAVVRPPRVIDDV
jgi:hypothetical protein